MKKLRGVALLFLALSAVALSAAVIALWWWSWGEVISFAVIGAILLGCGIFAFHKASRPKANPKLLTIYSKGTSKQKNGLFPGKYPMAALGKSYSELIRMGYSEKEIREILSYQDA